MFATLHECAGLRLAGAVVLASGFAFSAAAQFAEPDAVALQTFTGTQSGETYGWAVADLADIDGDGVTEVISGAPFNTTGGVRSGRVEVRSGATGAVLHEFLGDAPEDFLGYSIADAGDVDGDGVNDIVAGGPRADGFLGQVVVWSGATGDVLFTQQSPPTSLFLGAAVSAAGDINGDGHDDVLAGAPFGADGFLAGEAYVFSGADGSILRTYPGQPGAAFGWGTALTGDVDGDGVGEHIISAAGFGEAYVFSGGAGDLLYTLQAEPTNGAFGQFFVAGAGDIDGDCIDDFYVGDFADDVDPSDNVLARGAAYVFSGADGSRIRFYTGEEGDGMGPGRGAGDVDADGYDDLIIGSFTNSDAIFRGGRIDVISGADGAILQQFTGTVENAQLGFDCVGMGDADGDNAIDFILSAANGDLVYIGAGDHVRCTGDLNGDGVVNPKDVRIWFGSYAAGSCVGDINGDGATDGNDFVLIVSNFGRCK